MHGIGNCVATLPSPTLKADPGWALRNIQLYISRPGIVIQDLASPACPRNYPSGEPTLLFMALASLAS